jgi:methylated-DNA-[protein]-cysteine S-methyltransferase
MGNEGRERDGVVGARFGSGRTQGQAPSSPGPAREALTLAYESPLGWMTLAQRDGKLVGACFDGQKHDRANLGASAQAQPGEDETLDEAAAWLDAYFAGEEPTWLPPLRPVGTDFQRCVWLELLAIPYGRTTTYGQIARCIATKTGRKASARAVGAAVGRNPVSILIPCHRVLGADGSLTGYAGGTQRKLSLLSLEGAHV